ncbi:MAG: pyridoxal phosphate-dependent aminotransferase [Myxococcota bacterium]
MPRFPHVTPTVAAMKGSPYSALAHRLAAYDGPIYPLNVGDTWMEPALGSRMQDLTVEQHPGMHRYTSAQGHPVLLDAIAQRIHDRTGVVTDRGNVLVTAGGTGGLGAVAGAFVSPGDEVLIAAPHWPLIAGIVRCFHGVPVTVPLVGPVTTAEEAVAAFAQRLTSRTVAIYLNTPNNPTGAVYPREWIEAIVRWAAARDLWIWSDEVYEDYVYEGEHTWVRPLAPERTFSAFSFSKAYGMAGNRVGYIVGPSQGISHVLKVSTHTFYSAPTASQLAAAQVLGPAGDDWLAHAFEQYRALGFAAADRLGVARPGGSTFLFLDVEPHLDERGLHGLLEDLVDKGLLVAPGPSFGPYPTHIRVCFTCADPSVVERGVDVLARHLGR